MKLEPAPDLQGPARTKPGLARRAYAFLVSPKLAIAILVAVLACCLAGVTVFRGEEAWRLIFSTLWFNAMLVLLAVSSAAAFFTRIWRRKLTLVSAGMILFHVSFAALLGGVVLNGLFHFKGVLRLTEGETLPVGRLESYDVVEHGRFFDFDRLRGEATLVRMHTKYEVDGEDKRAAYEVVVGEGSAKKAAFVYVTNALRHEGIRYLAAKEGYSVLVALKDLDGREIYAAHVPLQSIKHPNGGYLYATGSPTDPESFPFPPPPDEPLGDLLVTYRPNTVEERTGDVGFQIVPRVPGVPEVERGGQVVVGATFDAGPFALEAREIRYWVGMDVRYDPGLWIILGSFCAGLAGMVMILAGRLRQGAARSSRGSAAGTRASEVPGARQEIA